MTADLLTVDYVTDWMLNFGGDLETKSHRCHHVINEARTYVYCSGQISSDRMHELPGDSADGGDMTGVE